MSKTPISDLDLLLKSMAPRLNPGSYTFATLPPGKTLAQHDVISSMREAEGVSVIVETTIAEREELEALFTCAWITLNVNSDLAAVGLTSAFSTALGKAGISCNVVAGAFHDHIFVPIAEAEAAMRVLQSLQREGLR